MILKSLKLSKNTSYTFLIIGIYIFLKYIFKYANNDNLGFLLKPTNKLVKIFTGTFSTFDFENGYYFNELNIIIDKSCSGFHLWSLSFIMLAFLGLKHLNKSKWTIFVIPLALITAHIFTVFVNTSRIVVSIIFKNITIFHLDSTSIHEMLGITINITFLIFFYLLTDRLLINFKNITNEKLS